MRCRYRGRYRMPDLVNSNQTVYYNLPLLFGVHPVKPNGSVDLRDISAGLAPDNDLAVTVTWAANSTMGTTGVTTGATSAIRLTLYGVILEDGDPRINFYPSWLSTSFAPTQTYAGLGAQIQLTPGFYYRRTTLMDLLGATTNSGDVRSNGTGSAATSEIAFQTADGRKNPLNLKFWDFQHLTQGMFEVADDNGDVAGATLAGGASVTKTNSNAGVGLIDYLELAETKDPTLADPQYGINLIGKNIGAANLNFTIDVSTNNVVGLFHETYLPYQM
jgi:hypothetical protein